MTTPDPGSATASPASPSQRWVPFLVAGAFFMEMLDATVITTALPDMGRSFGVEPARLSIGISAYMLALAVFIPISGWLADRYGPRRVFASAIAVFTLASVWCGLSSSLWEFTAARVFQGLGGAMMVPVGRLVVLRGTAKKDLVRAIATITWPGLAAPVIGPPVGGWITTWLSWHWIFFLNLPLGLLALVMTLRLIRGPADGAGPFDVFGFVLSGVSLSALMLGLEFASQPQMNLWLAFGMVAAGVAGMVFTVRHWRRTPHPLIDLSALRVPTFAVTLVGGSLFRIAIASAPFLLPLMFQLAFGLSAVTAGSLLFALFAGNLAIKPATSWVIRRFGFRRVLVVNGLLVGLGMAACGLLWASVPLPLIAALLFVCGVTRSMQFTAYNTIGFADLRPPQMSGATALFSVFQQMNAGFGIAFGALALRVAQWSSGHVGATPAVGDFRIAFFLVALVAFAGMIDSWMLARDAGSAVSGHSGQDGATAAR
ncbi:MAG: transporter [Rhizobacter sp.]|nr:transporter [Rhizobacter sp.]